MVIQALWCCLDRQSEGRTESHRAREEGQCLSHSVGVGVHKLTPARRKKRHKAHMLNRSNWFQKDIQNALHFRILNFHIASLTILQVQLWKTQARIFFKKTLEMYQAKFWHGNRWAFSAFSWKPSLHGCQGNEDEQRSLRPQETGDSGRTRQIYANADKTWQLPQQRNVQGFQGPWRKANGPECPGWLHVCTKLIPQSWLNWTSLYDIISSLLLLLM